MFDEYLEIVTEFKELLEIKSPVSESCCLTVYDGAPHCCWTLVENISCLEFTSREIDLIWPDRRSQAFTLDLPEEGVILHRHGLNRWFSTPTDRKLMTDSLNRGVLNATIECAAHPTRPIVSRGTVVGVASVNDCIAEWGLHLLLGQKDRLTELWAQAVDLIGEKSYYVRRNGLVVL